MQQGSCETVCRTRFISSQKIKKKKTQKNMSLSPVSGSLTVTGIGILGTGMIFMGDDVK